MSVAASIDLAAEGPDEGGLFISVLVAAADAGEHAGRTAGPVGAAAARSWRGPARGDVPRLRRAVARAAARAFRSPVEHGAAVAARRAAGFGSPARSHAVGTAVSLVAGTVGSIGGLAVATETASGAAVSLTPATVAATAGTAVLAQLAQFYLACGVIGYELLDSGRDLGEQAVLRALVRTYHPTGQSGLSGGRAARLVAGHLGARAAANLVPLVGVVRGAYLANVDLRRARTAARLAADRPPPATGG